LPLVGEERERILRLVRESKSRVEDDAVG
jgi:hypothetical protein